ncbi:linoleate 9S-lipoxygenase 6 [Cannabis sativa]|uniref:linoleate 9S-lipoxygenase 6 n=1 Tax=Cannabis sativa TaxID=3483 RepID=UPI0029C9FEDE|nr:linoleate 9S-lipoxygenase 6 [Cannabis sativa]
MLLGKGIGVVDSFTGGLIGGNNKGKKIKGSVVLVKKNVLEFNPLASSVNTGTAIFDRFAEFLGSGVSLQLVSGHTSGKLSKEAHLENWITSLPALTPGDSVFKVTFDWDESIGVPEAIIFKNNHLDEFFLKTITLDDVPAQGVVRFICNSWVYTANKYNYNRVFFRNKSYIPSATPAPLLKYRKEELENLRGNGLGQRKEWDRVYDYDLYNDLGEPDKGRNFSRKTLGGNSEFPYPRRGRTGRPTTKSDSRTESRLKQVNLMNPLDPVESLDIYVPRDERFGHLKMSDFLAYGIKSLTQAIIPALKHYFDQTRNEFDNFQEVLDLYEGGLKLPKSVLDNIRKNVPFDLLKEMFRTDGEQFLKFPLPHVIKEDKSAWRTDEEFGREMVAGVHPVLIRRLEEFPPTSKLDPELYGDHTSTITEDHIKNSLEGLGVFEALFQNKLFILDHHDSYIPYLRRINSTSSKAYATRTLVFLTSEGTLKPVAIELSLPHPNGDEFGVVSKVYTPAEEGVEGTIWQLAKAYAAVTDSGYHQLISHWLNTHAVIEPFVIATNRQLSALHPIYKLLQPHYRDTMNINALARQSLVSVDGVIESTFLPGKYAMELSAVVYKDWVFTDQALPADLLKRGIAEKDVNAPHGLRLLIEDYPYAVDGLEIWSAIKAWVKEYCSHYYNSDASVQRDTELQAWWKEVREVGHGDKKDETWWPKMKTREELVESCTILIWISSALHAAVNFGQYSFTGYLPNRPTLSRRFMPEEGTPEYEQLKSDPEKGFLLTITSEFQSLVGIALVEVLSRHASDEVYLGQRENPDWTLDAGPLQAFDKFGRKLVQIEDAIVRRNNDLNMKNRAGPVKFPYGLLIPTSDQGLTGRGIPNSISI